MCRIWGGLRWMLCVVPFMQLTQACLLYGACDRKWPVPYRRRCWPGYTVTVTVRPVPVRWPQTVRWRWPVPRLTKRTCSCLIEFTVSLLVQYYLSDMYIIFSSWDAFRLFNNVLFEYLKISSKNATSILKPCSHLPLDRTRGVLLSLKEKCNQAPLGVLCKHA